MVLVPMVLAPMVPVPMVLALMALAPVALAPMVAFMFLIQEALPRNFAVLQVLITLRLKENLKENLGVNQGSRLYDIANQQMTRTVIAVTIFFVVSLSFDSWYFLLSLTDGIQYDVSSQFQIIGAFLVIVNSCANPIIYCTSMPIFRKSLNKTFRCTTLSIQNFT